MGVIAGYVRWAGHDAGGTLPPLDVVAGLLADVACGRFLASAPLAPGETLVIVPPQWLGDWQSGRRLPPGYQFVWRAPRAALRPLAGAPLDPPYRPATLPPSAMGHRLRRPA